MSKIQNDTPRKKTYQDAMWLSDVMRKTLADCVEAQHETLEKSLDLIESTAFRSSDGSSEPVMVTFSIQMDGESHTLRVPLLVLVPLPFLQISQADLTFFVSIMSSNTSQQEGLKVRFSPSNKLLTESRQTGYDVRNNIRVNIKASAELPAGGMSRLLQIVGNNCIRIRKPDEPTDNQ